jgi:copper(I)-binding protein
MICVSAAGAHDYEIKTLTIGHPWAPITHGNLATGVVYVTLVNDGKKADRLLKVSSPWAASATLHSTMKDGEVMGMRDVESVSIPAGTTVEFKPGDLHIMLMGLIRPLKDGDMVPLTLTLANEGEVKIEAMVVDQ